MNYEDIKPYIEKKLISEQKHPENEDVRIFNYTQLTQYSKAWDEVTRACRGLIMNVKTGEILARPFPKFFNHAEHVQNGWPIPDETPVIAEKLDGSLGILYWLNDMPWIATRGSFTSDQAIWATKWFREIVGDGDWNRITNITHLFEVIFPENRIVVNYDFSGLVHLASIHTATGEAVPYQWPLVRSAKIIPHTTLDELAKLDEPNSEGFVIFYPKANVRMKIKFPEYVRLHKIITGVSEIGIWEILRDGGDFKPLLEKVPDEFFKWVEETKGMLEERFARVEELAMNEFEQIVLTLPETRKEWAGRILKMSQPGLGFAMLDKKDYKPMIWKLIRPHGPRVFKTDVDA